ncbi:MAG TPA: hypothetical protein PKY95_06685, partial [candidate division Zixibacteria bacterium]|nr:hypothetical protein [candidate division Zixibacteria bacterium]
MSPEKHLTRKRLIEIARAGTPPSDSHLAACDVCREAYEMLSRYYSLIGRPPLPAPPADFLRRARSIAREGAPSGARLVEV